MSMEQNAYPVLLMTLEESDTEFTHVDSRRRTPTCFVEQVDTDRFYFTNEPAAQIFMEVHGLVGVTDDEMQEARKAGGYAE